MFINTSIHASFTLIFTDSRQNSQSRLNLIEEGEEENEIYHRRAT